MTIYLIYAGIIFSLNYLISLHAWLGLFFYADQITPNHYPGNYTLKQFTLSFFHFQGDSGSNNTPTPGQINKIRFCF